MTGRLADGETVDEDTTNDVHDTPLTRGTDRMHELSRDCWCKPLWKDRIGTLGRIVIHRGG